MRDILLFNHKWMYLPWSAINLLEKLGYVKWVLDNGVSDRFLLMRAGILDKEESYIRICPIEEKEAVNE